MLAGNTTMLSNLFFERYLSFFKKRLSQSNKVHIFYKNKILRNLHLTFDYSTYSQKLGEDFKKSEYMNFKRLWQCCLFHSHFLKKVISTTGKAFLHHQKRFSKGKKVIKQKEKKWFSTHR